MFQPSAEKKLLSDHMPFIGKSKNECFIGWNILCQMKFSSEWKYFNNGFMCPDETQEQYANRLMHIAAKLNAAATTETPAFICLQECPETDASRTHFAEALKKGELQHYGINFYNNNDDEYYLITLYDARRYTPVDKLSEEMSHVQLSEGLKGRVQPLVYSSNKTGEVFLVINVHANFSKDVKQDVNALYQRAKELGIKNIILLGDFNRDLVLESDDYSKHDISKALDSSHRLAGDLYVSATHGASFCTKYDKETEKKGQGLETRDGVISTFPVDTVCMTNANSPDVALSYTREISPHLSSIPDGFLEKLLPKIDDATSSASKAPSKL